jgi:hypothetical protein
MKRNSRQHHAHAQQDGIHTCTTYMHSMIKTRYPRYMYWTSQVGTSYLSAAEYLKLLAAFTSQKVTSFNNLQQHNNEVINSKIKARDTFDSVILSCKVIATCFVLCRKAKVYISGY